MPTRLTIKNKKFFRELENGTAYNLNPISFGNHLKGSVMNRIKMTADVEVYHYFDLQNFNIENSSGEWSIYQEGAFNEGGIWIGDIITLRMQSGAFNGTVTSISNDYLTFNNTYGTPPSTGETNVKRRVKLSTPSSDLRYNYNIQEQLESFDLQSLINEGESSFIVKNIPNIISNGIGDWSETNKSIKNGILNCSLSNTPLLDDDPIGKDLVVYQYSIEHEFILAPYYLDGWDLLGEPNEIFKGANTLRYVANYGFRRGYNNPNTQVNGIDDNGLGSVGALGETFNGFENRYSLENYTIKDTNGFTISGINVAETNRITFTVKTDKTSGGFSTNQHGFVAYVSRLPDFDKYKYSDTDDFETIWGFGSSRGLLNSGVQSLTGYFNLATINIIDDQTADVELQISFPSDYINRTENEDRYVIAFEVGDITQIIDDSDSINLVAEVNQFSKDINIQGLVNTSEFDIKRTSDNVGFSDFKGWIQHGVNVTNRFSMNLDNRAVIESVEFGLMAQSGLNFFDIYRGVADLSSIVNVNGVQNINYISTQGYKLAENSVFNNISLMNLGQTVPNNEDYALNYGLKIPYQDWQRLNGVPTVFYDVTKEQNGFNKNASNYDVNTYELRMFLDVTASQDGISTLYRSVSPVNTILNFGEDGNDPVQWTATIETFNLANEPLGGSVLIGEPTTIRATFNAPNPITNIFGAIRIGEERHGGNAVDELTNASDYPDNNRLKPLTGETSLKVTTVGNQTVIECQTDPNNLEQTNYIICAELFETNAPVIQGAFTFGFSNGFDV